MIKDYEAWPRFSYQDFQPSMHLVHMLTQAIGKLKLFTPFEPEWANVGLWITADGITTGLIPYQQAGFSVDVSFITHTVNIKTTWGQAFSFALQPMSVAQLTTTLFEGLKRLSINLTVNPKPQEVPNPILFHEDTLQRDYNKDAVNAWWRILVSSQRVMQLYHARFLGKTQSVALMWGTLDIRDVRYNGHPVTPTGMNSGYLRRNAMDEELVESGWWAGNEMYPHAAYYSFTYTEPEDIANSKIEPSAARWEKALSEFLLPYDDVYQSKDPDATLLAFLESTYQKGSQLAHWDPKLVGCGKPL